MRDPDWSVHCGNRSPNSIKRFTAGDRYPAFMRNLLSKSVESISDRRFLLAHAMAFLDYPFVSVVITVCFWGEEQTIEARHPRHPNHSQHVGQ